MPATALKVVQLFKEPPNTWGSSARATVKLIGVTDAELSIDQEIYQPPSLGWLYPANQTVEVAQSASGSIKQDALYQDICYWLDGVFGPATASAGAGTAQVRNYVAPIGGKSSPRSYTMEFGTTAGTPQSNGQKRYNYWIDLEANALPGWWWDTIQVAITNTPNLTDIFNIVDGVMKQFFQFTLPAALPGDPALYVHQDLEFGANIGTILCSVSLWALFRHALMEDRVGVSVAGSSSGITNNIYYGLFKLIGSPYIT